MARRVRAAAWLLLVCLAAGLTPAAPAPSSPDQEASADQEALVRQGQQVFRLGTGSGEEIQALLADADLEIPASAVPCASCHGHDGRGRPEGGLAPSDITWRNLTRPGGLIHSGGRRHGPYDERSLLRAITLGVDPAGNELNTAMPRYRLSLEDGKALVAYLKTLGEQTDPGITGDLIRLGLLLPPPEHLPGGGNAVEALARAYAERRNRGGGLYGRQVELHVLEAPDAAPARREALERFLEDEKVFALVAPYFAGAEEQIAPLIDRRQVPAVGPFVVRPQLEFPLNRWIFYLLPGLEQQARALVDFAARELTLDLGKALVLHADRENLEPVVEALRAQMIQAQIARRDFVHPSEKERLPDPVAAVLPFEPATFSAAEVVRRPQVAGADTLFLLGSPEETQAFLTALAAAGGSQRLLLLGPLAGPVLYRLPPSLAGNTYAALPTLERDQAPRGLELYRSLAQEATADGRPLANDHPSLQLQTLAALDLLFTALEKAGRDLSREKLVETLEGFYAYENGLTPTLSYGPNRRVGALGAYVLQGASEGGLVLQGGWVTPR